MPLDMSREPGPEPRAPLLEAVASATERTMRTVMRLVNRVTALEARAPIQGPQGERGDVGPRGDRGDVGPSGRSIQTVCLDGDGNLAFAFDDGAIVTLGRVVGRDGVDGANGRDADPEEVVALRREVDILRAEIAALRVEAKGGLSDADFAGRIAVAVGE